MKQKNWLNKLSYQKSIENTKVPFGKQIIMFLLINLAMILLLVFSILILPPQIPLFYGLPDGEEQLAANWLITLPNFIALFTVFINSLLATKIKDEYIKKVIVIAGFVVTIFAIITVFKILFLVGNI
jgi:hypothetical protein